MIGMLIEVARFFLWRILDISIVTVIVVLFYFRENLQGRGEGGDTKNQEHPGYTIFVWASGVFVFTPLLYPSKKVAGKDRRQNCAAKLAEFLRH